MDVQIRQAMQSLYYFSSKLLFVSTNGSHFVSTNGIFKINHEYSGLAVKNLYFIRRNEDE